MKIDLKKYLIYDALLNKKASQQKERCMRTIVLKVSDEWFEALSDYLKSLKYYSSKRRYIIEAVDSMIESQCKKGFSMPKSKPEKVKKNA
jgi:hypothetical protein